MLGSVDSIGTLWALLGVVLMLMFVEISSYLTGGELASLGTTKPSVTGGCVQLWVNVGFFAAFILIETGTLQSLRRELIFGAFM